MIAPLIRNAVTAGAAAFVLAFSQMDANPSLFMFDRFFVNDHRVDACFRGKTMWITGASSGIGAELAMQLSRNGVNLILSARQSDRLDSVAEECQRLASQYGNATVTIVPVDLSSSVASLEKTVDAVLQSTHEGLLDFVVMNAGSGQLRPASFTRHETTEQLFQVNTLAPITLTQILLERGALKEDKGKHIVVTSSVAAKMGVPLSASYAASKHALHGYYNSLKAELPWLRVDLICPGSTDTDFHQSHIGGSQKKIPTDEEKAPSKKLKMSVKRCTTLLVSSVMMSPRPEYWIAEHPVLLGLFINQYFPGIFQKTLSRIGPMRIRAWEEGKDLYDPKTWK